MSSTSLKPGLLVRVNLNSIWTVIFYTLIGLLLVAGFYVIAIVWRNVGLLQGLRIYGEWEIPLVIGGIIHHYVRLVNIKPSVLWKRVLTWMAVLPVVLGIAFVAPTPWAMVLVFGIAFMVALSLYVRVEQQVKSGSRPRTKVPRKMSGGLFVRNRRF